MKNIKGTVLILGVVVITKDRPLNVAATMSHNRKFFGSLPVVLVDASSHMHAYAEVPEVFYHIRSPAGQYLQKSLGSQFLIKEHGCTHILFIDDDVYVNFQVRKFIEYEYSSIGGNLGAVALSLCIVEFFGRSRVFDLIMTDSLKRGKLSRNTFTANNCLGYQVEIDWALGGACCWPAEFCPSSLDGYPVSSGKGFCEDSFLSSVRANDVRIFSSSYADISHHDLYLQNASRGASFSSGWQEAAARLLVSRSSDYYDPIYCWFSVLFVGVMSLCFGLFRLNFNNVAYGCGLFLGALSSSVFNDRSKL